MTAVRHLRSRLGSAHGQAQVEFACITVLLIILIVSVIELIMLMHTYSVLADAANEGVRYATVHGNRNSIPSGPSCPCTDIDGPPAPPGSVAGYGTGYGVVKTYAQYSLHDLTGITVTVAYPDTNNKPANQAGNRIQVSISYPYRPLFSLQGWTSSWTVTVNANAEGRIMN